VLYIDGFFLNVDSGSLEYLSKRGLEDLSKQGLEF